MISVMPGWMAYSNRCGVDAGLRMKSALDWFNNNGNDASGFRVLPGGRSYASTSSSLHYSGFLWSSDENATSAWMRAFFSGDQVTRDSYNKLNALSLRCLRD